MMNLSSPIFDPIRIPPRRTPDSIAMAICDEEHVDLDRVRSALLHPRDPDTKKIRATRVRIAKAMRANGVATSTIQAFFTGLSPNTVRDYLLEDAA